MAMWQQLEILSLFIEFLVSIWLNLCTCESNIWQRVQGFHSVTLLVRLIVLCIYLTHFIPRHIIPLYYTFCSHCFICFRFFRYFFDLAIAINAVFIATDVTEAEWFFLALFTVEIMLKFYVYGPRRFVGILWNM